MEFREITNKNIWKVCTLEVEENQKDFVAENLQSLAEAYATRNEGNNAFPFGIYDNDTLVGFIMIGKGTVGNENESDTIKENYVLWRLMIDKKYQHKGYGKEAITKALNMMRNDELSVGKAKYCWLSYEPENVVAREFYLKMGFKETNEMCGNEIMAIIELQEPLLILKEYKTVFTTNNNDGRSVIHSIHTFYIEKIEGKYYSYNGYIDSGVESLDNAISLSYNYAYIVK